MMVQSGQSMTPTSCTASLCPYLVLVEGLSLGRVAAEPRRHVCVESEGGGVSEFEE